MRSSDERRAHQCHHPHCDSEAKWRLCLHMSVQLVGGVVAPLHCESTYRICEGHVSWGVDKLLSGSNKEHIVAELAKNGWPMPDFHNARVIAVPADLVLASDQRAWDEARRLSPV